MEEKDREALVEEAEEDEEEQAAEEDEEVAGKITSGSESLSCASSSRIMDPKWGMEAMCSEKREVGSRWGRSKSGEEEVEEQDEEEEKEEEDVGNGEVAVSKEEGDVSRNSEKVGGVPTVPDKFPYKLFCLLSAASK